jgi:hypothetical protein
MKLYVDFPPTYRKGQGAEKPLFKEHKDLYTMFVDLLTLSIYFTKLFGIHRNIFTCRIIKLKN